MTAIHSILHRFRVWQLLLLLAISSAGMAAPVNDSFANQIEVFNGGTNAVTGSNVGATIEAGEPIPAGYTTANYQATVWYVFKPAADAWYEVNTLGSAIDTVLAVWSGTNMSDMSLVNVNNEAFEGSVSRIRFQSHGAPDVSYFISVAGRNAAARGNIKLTVQLGGNQMILTDSIFPAPSVSPSTVDVSSAPASTTFSVEMAVASDVLAGYVHLYSPDGRQVASTSYSVANRINGTNNDGTYSMTLTVPRYLTPGTYMLGFEAQNSLTNRLGADSYGWDQMTSLGSPLNLTVQNSGPVDTYTQFTVDNGLTGSGAAQTADPDADGLSNLTEFAFGLDPNVPNRVPLTVTGGTLVSRGTPKGSLTGTGSQQRLRVEFIRRVADASQGLSYQVEFSDDLLHWTAATNSAVVEATSGGYEAVTVDDQTTGAVSVRRFGHVVITYQLP